MSKKKLFQFVLIIFLFLLLFVFYKIFFIQKSQIGKVENQIINKNKIPFINKKILINKTLKIMSDKNLGTLIVINKKKYTTGIITDGQIRRLNQKKFSFDSLKVSDVMTRNPIKIDKNTLAAKALSIKNEKKITSLCVYSPKNKSITIGILHIHNILDKKIY